METVILSGLQGAGNSTYCREKYWDSHIRLNCDMLRTRHREHLLLKACIEAKQSFVVDAINPTAKERARYIGPVKAARFRVVGIEFRTSLEVALQRNTQRQGKARIPDKAIKATAKCLGPLDFDEEFDEIWIAHVVQNTRVLQEVHNAL